MLKSLAPFWIPFSRALNHGMPAIFPTVTISFWACAKPKPGKPAPAIAAAPPITLSVWRLSIVPSQESILGLATLNPALARYQQSASFLISAESFAHLRTTWFWIRDQRYRTCQATDMLSRPVPPLRAPVKAFRISANTQCSQVWHHLFCALAGFIADMSGPRAGR